MRGSVSVVKTVMVVLSLIVLCIPRSTLMGMPFVRTIKEAIYENMLSELKGRLQEKYPVRTEPWISLSCISDSPSDKSLAINHE